MTRKNPYAAICGGIFALSFAPWLFIWMFAVDPYVEWPSDMEEKGNNYLIRLFLIPILFSTLCVTICWLASYKIYHSKIKCGILNVKVESKAIDKYELVYSVF
jgi:hypothetical protein